MEKIKLFKNKVVLVIGAANPLCRCIVNAFLEEEACVIVPAASFHDIEVIRAYRRNKEYKTLITQLTCVTEYNNLWDLCEAIVEKFGKIDIVIILSGADAPARRLSEVTFENWGLLFETDLNPFFISANIALQVMKANKAGMVVYVTDCDGFENGSLKRLALALKRDISKEFAEEAIKHELKYYHLWVQYIFNEKSYPVEINVTGNSVEMVSERIMKLYGDKAYYKDQVFQFFPETVYNF